MSAGPLLQDIMKPSGVSKSSTLSAETGTGGRQAAPVKPGRFGKQRDKSRAPSPWCSSVAHCLVNSSKQTTLSLAHSIRSVSLLLSLVKPFAGSQSMAFSRCTLLFISCKHAQCRLMHRLPKRHLDLRFWDNWYLYSERQWISILSSACFTCDCFNVSNTLQLTETKIKLHCYYSDYYCCCCFDIF